MNVSIEVDISHVEGGLDLEVGVAVVGMVVIRSNSATSAEGRVQHYEVVPCQQNRPI